MEFIIMVEIYTPKQMIEHANKQFNKFYNLVVASINIRLKNEFSNVSTYVDISDIYEFYSMQNKNVLWNKIVNDFSDKNWDIFSIRVEKFTTVDDTIDNYKWKIAVKNLKQ
jgi:hypothetical protein